MRIPLTTFLAVTAFLMGAALPTAAADQAPAAQEWKVAQWDSREGRTFQVDDARFLLREVNLALEDDPRNVTVRVQKVPDSYRGTPAIYQPIFEVVDVSLTAPSALRVRAYQLVFDLDRSLLSPFEVKPEHLVAFYATKEGAAWELAPTSIALSGSDVIVRTRVLPPDAGRVMLAADPYAPDVQGVSPPAGSLIGAGHASVEARAIHALSWALRDGVIRINGDAVPTKLEAGRLLASLPEDLPDGKHVFEATVKSPSGSEGHTRWSALVDRTPPVIAEDAFAVEHGPGFLRIDVRWNDTVSGVNATSARAIVDGFPVRGFNKSATPEGANLNLTQRFLPGSHFVDVEVTDNAGNRAVARRTFEVAGVKPDTPAPGAALATIALVGVALALTARGRLKGRER